MPDLDWEKKFHKIAKMCAGFSGREIAKLSISWQVRTSTGTHHYIRINTPYFTKFIYIHNNQKHYHYFIVTVHMLLYYNMQARAHGSQDGKLTEEMVDTCVKEMVQQHQQKQVWNDEEIKKRTSTINL